MQQSTRPRVPCAGKVQEGGAAAFRAARRADCLKYDHGEPACGRARVQRRASCVGLQPGWRQWDAAETRKT
eukprot:15433279-Alexandrium_andersonii.AAC.1